jgi:cell division transport system permease protein
MKKRSLFNMYFTTTISVALVLFLVGLESMLFLSAHELMRHVKESMVLSIVMTENANDEDVARMERLLDVVPYSLDYQYISREQALQEHIDNLGEDPQAFLGFNPLTDAFEVHLNATYAQTDSVTKIEESLMTLPFVDKVVYQKDVMKVLDNNLSEVSLILSGIAVILLLIALVLISNTIQLQVYSKRFIINTMRLVGATPWVIKWPFVRRNMRMGIEAALVALILLAMTYYYCQVRLGVVLFPLIWQNVGFVVALMLVIGLMITFLASVAATNRYIRMKTSKMYEI